MVYVATTLTLMRMLNVFRFHSRSLGKVQLFSETMGRKTGWANKKCCNALSFLLWSKLVIEDPSYKQREINAIRYKLNVRIDSSE